MNTGLSTYNIGLSTYSRLAVGVAEFELEGMTAYMRANENGSIDLTYLPHQDKLDEETSGKTMVANRDMRRSLLNEIRKDLQASNLDESNITVKEFLADAKRQLNCDLDVKLEISGQDLKGETVRGLLDRLEEVKAQAGDCDVDMEMLDDRQVESLTQALELSDKSKLKDIEFRKTSERSYGCAVFEADVPSDGPDPAKRRRVRVLMQHNGLFKLESKVSVDPFAGDVDMKMLDDKQLTSLAKALGFPNKDALDEIGFTKTGEKAYGRDVFEAAFTKPGATQPRYVRVLMGADRLFKLESDVAKQMKPSLPKLPTRPKKTVTANPNVVTEIPVEDGLNVLQRIKKGLKSPWKPGEEPDWWKEAKGLKG